MKEFLICDLIMLLNIFATSSVAMERKNSTSRKLWKPPVIHRIVVRTGSPNPKERNPTYYNETFIHNVTTPDSKTLNNDTKNPRDTNVTVSPKLGKSKKQKKPKNRNRYTVTDVKGNINRGSYRNRLSQRNRNRNNHHRKMPKHRNHQISHRGRNGSKNRKSQQRGRHTSSQIKNRHNSKGNHHNNRGSHRNVGRYRTSHHKGNRKHINRKGIIRKLHRQLKSDNSKLGKINDTKTITDLEMKGSIANSSPSNRKNTADNNSSYDETGALELRTLIADALCDFCRTIKSKRCRRKYCF